MQTGLRILREEVIPNGDNEVLLPVNLARLVAKAQALFATQASQAVDTSLGPEQIINGVRSLLQKLMVVPGKDELSSEAQRNATVLLFNHIRSTLASKRVCFKLTVARESERSVQTLPSTRHSSKQMLVLLLYQHCAAVFLCSCVYLERSFHSSRWQMAEG